jgi:hypothetical protein
VVVVDYLLLELPEVLMGLEVLEGEGFCIVVGLLLLVLCFVVACVPMGVVYLLTPVVIGAVYLVAVP